MTAATHGSIRAAWVNRAEELTTWALARLFVRTDRYGGYSSTGGKLTLPSSGRHAGVANRDLLLRHFRATRTEHVVGAHPLTPGERELTSARRHAPRQECWLYDEDQRLLDRLWSVD